MVSSNQSGTAQFWHPARAGLLSPVVKLKETAALAVVGPDGSTGIVVATSLGLVRWHQSFRRFPSLAGTHGPR